MRASFRLLILTFLITTLTLFSTSPTYSETADIRDTDSPYGALVFLAWDHDWNDFQYPNFDSIRKAVALMKEAGIKIVRLDINWSEVEIAPGNFNFEKHDRIVNHLLENDIKVLALLQYNPAWTGKAWNDPPDKELFTNYVRHTVRHFKDRIKYWEIWNEPDHRTYWTVQDRMTTYTELLKAVYVVLKEEDPTCQVLVGAPTNHLVVSLKNVYRSGGKDYFDIINLHPFQNPTDPNALDHLRGIYKGVKKTMEQFGDGEKHIWFTEIGAPGVKDPQNAPGWWAGVTPTEEEQAEWVRQIYTEPLEWEGVGKIFWAFFRDTRHFNNAVDSFGLVTRDFKKKPAFYAYQKVSQTE